MASRVQVRQTIKVLLADDQLLARQFLKPFLSQHGIEIIDQAFTREELMRKSRELSPDIILLNAFMPGIDDREVCQSILTQQPETHILKYFRPNEWRCFVSARGIEIPVRVTSAAEMIRTIRAIAEGRFYPYPMGPSTGFQAVPPIDTAPEAADLTDIQIHILGLVAKGFRNRDIAQQLGLRVQTVKNNLCIIFQELGVNNRTAAVMVALRLGLISGQPSDGEREVPGRENLGQLSRP